ncbi:MAG TPA: adenylate/guanylate cyclase domain-containing protein [bacterium]|nr:adenylate/guanylate cyclase domain-containing protein [bacterium]
MATPPRGTVTLAFTDVQGSTQLWERQPVAMRRALELHDALARKLLAERGGYEVKSEGDSFMVAFADPVAAVP